MGVKYTRIEEIYVSARNGTEAYWVCKIVEICQ